MVTLQVPVKQGGSAVPNVRLYQLAAQLHYVAERINRNPESVWLDLESFNAGNALLSLLFAPELKKIEGVIDDNKNNSAGLTSDKKVRRPLKNAFFLGSYTPQDRLCSTCVDGGLKTWEDVLFDKGVMLSFEQLHQKYK